MTFKNKISLFIFSSYICSAIFVGCQPSINNAKANESISKISDSSFKYELPQMNHDAKKFYVVNTRWRNGY